MQEMVRMQEMVMPKVVRIQETVRMQEMGRMQEMVMKDREWGKPSGYHGWAAGAVAPTSLMHHGTEARQGPGLKARDIGAASGSDGCLAQVWRGLDSPRAGVWWPGGAGVREVRIHTMGPGAQSGQEGCDTEDWWEGEGGGVRGQRTRHRMILIRNEGYRRERESVTCLVVSDSSQPHGLQPTRLLCPWDSPGKNAGVVAMPSSRGSFQPRDQTQVSCLAGGFLAIWATREALARGRRC